MVFGVRNLQSRAEGFTKFGLGDRKKIRADERWYLEEFWKPNTTENGRIEEQKEEWKNYVNSTSRLINSLFQRIQNSDPLKMIYLQNAFVKMIFVRNDQTRIFQTGIYKYVRINQNNLKSFHPSVLPFSNFPSRRRISKILPFFSWAPFSPLLTLFVRI